MRPFTPRAARPTPAERVRSVLAAAHSMTVVSDGVRREVHRLDGTGPMERVHLCEPSGEGHAGSPVRVPVRLEFTDIAPTPVRDRLRARVTLTGLLAAPRAAGTGGIGTGDIGRVEFGQAVVEAAGDRDFVTLEELHAADADPLASHEAAMLTHLVDRHAELVPCSCGSSGPAPRGTRSAPSPSPSTATASPCASNTPPVTGTPGCPSPLPSPMPGRPRPASTPCSPRPAAPPTPTTCRPDPDPT